MSELDRESRLLLQQALPALSPSDAAKTRARARLVALGTPPSDLPTPLGDEVTEDNSLISRVPAAKNHQGAALLGLGLSLGLALGGGGGFVLGTQLAPHAEQRNLGPVILQSPTLQVIQKPVREAATGDTIATSETSPHAPVSSIGVATNSAVRKPSREVRESSAPVESQLDGVTFHSEQDEVLWVQRVRKALARGEAQLALGLLRELDARVPGGRLGEERAAGRAIARCMLRTTAPHSEAEAFAARYPNSVHLDRVQATCSRQSRSGDETKKPFP